MSKKPCGCRDAQAGTVETANVGEQTAKPQIVPLPQALQERNRARRATYTEQVPDYLAEILVPVPEGAEPKNERGA